MADKPFIRDYKGSFWLLVKYFWDK